MSNKLRHAATFATVFGAGLLTLPLLEPDWRASWILLFLVLGLLALGVHLHRTENRPPKS
jgi:hypothetical protein